MMKAERCFTSFPVLHEAFIIHNTDMLFIIEEKLPQVK